MSDRDVDIWIAENLFGIVKPLPEEEYGILLPWGCKLKYYKGADFWLVVEKLRDPPWNLDFKHYRDPNVSNLLVAVFIDSENDKEYVWHADRIGIAVCLAAREVILDSRP